MPDAVPNYLSTNADGTVAAVFSGGVQILAGTDGTPPSARRVRWVKESDGAQVANIYSYNDGAHGGTLRLQSNDIGSPSPTIELTADGINGIGMLDAFAGSHINRILDSNGNSNYLQLGSVIPKNLQLQSGTFISAALGVGNNVVIVPLTSAWPQNHLLFIGQAQPNGAAFTLTSQYGGRFGSLANGFMHIITSVAQAVTIDWISLGN